MSGTNCIICFEQFQESSRTAPVMLSCGHSFCRGCLSNMSTPILCPICRVRHRGPDPTLLPTNYGLLGLASFIVGKLKDGIHETLSLSSSPVSTLYGSQNETTPLLSHQSHPVSSSTLHQRLTDIEQVEDLLSSELGRRLNPEEVEEEDLLLTEHSQRLVSAGRVNEGLRIAAVNPPYEAVSQYGSLQQPAILPIENIYSEQVNHGMEQSFSYNLIFSIFFGVSLCMYFAIMIIVGTLYIHYCPEEPNLPIWLIAEGILGLLLIIQAVDFYHNDRSKCRTAFFIIHLQYHFIILILATFRIYGSNNVDTQLYKFMFGIITTFYVLLILSFLISMCIYLWGIYPRDNMAVPKWKIFLFSIMFTLFLALVITGIMYSNNCPANHSASLWLILEGVSGIILLLQSVELSLNQGNKYKYSILVLHVIMNIIWFEVGSVWIYDSTTECDDKTYLVAFWFITITNVLIALSVLAGSLTLYIMNIPTQLHPESTPWKLAGVTMSLFIFSLSMILVGSLSEYCPDLPRVKTWLILEGSFGALLAMIYLDYKTHIYSNFRKHLLNINILFCLFLFICGTVWVLRSHQLYYSLSYIYALCIIIVFYGIFGLFIVFKCFSKCCCTS